MYTLLKEYANDLSKEAVKFTSELVGTPSPSLCERNVAKVVERRMNELGFDKVVVDGFGNVIGVIYGIASSPTVLLNCHMDTVLPEREDTDWHVPPYSGTVEGDRLYGLGSADCKAGLAMQVYAAHLLKRSLLPFRGNLIVAATVCEENGLSLGVQHLIMRTLADMNIKVDYAILGEPTALGLFYGHDGWAEFHIGLDSYNADVLHNVAGELFRTLADAGRLRKGQEDVELMKVKQPVFDLERSKAQILMSRRIFADDEADSLAQDIKDLTRHGLTSSTGVFEHKNSKEVGLEIRIREETQKLSNGETVQVRYLSQAWETNPFSPIMDRARQALESAGIKSVPGKWRLPQLGMGTAGSILTRKFGIPTIGYGPGDERIAHSPDEYVELDKISEGILGTASIVHSLVGVPVFGWTADLEI